MLSHSSVFFKVAFLIWISTTLFDAAFAFSVSVTRQELGSSPQRMVSSYLTRLCSSFFGDFEDFELEDDDEDDDDEDDDEEDEYDDSDDAASIAAFRSKMGNLFGEEKSTEDNGGGMGSVDELISYARSQSEGEPEQQEPTEWANPCDEIKPGVILVANPERFCDLSNSKAQPSPSLLAKFGLVRPPPRDLGPDRQADLLPVIALSECDKHNTRGVLLNRRTGYLLGDLEQPNPKIGEPMQILEKFCIQPLWFGGVDNSSPGLDMLHLCETVAGAKKLTDDGLYWGGDPSQAQEAMEDPALGRIVSGFDFKFFVQGTHWMTKELNKQIENGVWFPVEVSKELLFKSRDRMGTQKAKPLWTELMELMGGEYQEISNTFYDSEARE